MNELTATSNELGVEKKVFSVPQDLFIPHEPLEVLLENFSGPLDLLWYLIKKQDINVLDIPIAEIANQYLAYINIIKEFKLELAADYLVMAANLAEIKSKMLLPRKKIADEIEEDPRAELVRKLQEYEAYQQIGNKLSNLSRVGKDIFVLNLEFCKSQPVKINQKFTAEPLVSAILRVLKLSHILQPHFVIPEIISVRERMSRILHSLTKQTRCVLYKFLSKKEGKLGIAATMLGVLELAKQQAIEIEQNQFYDPIYIKSLTRRDE